MANLLWSMSTTMRNPERFMSFLATAAEIDGDVWTSATQIKYQVLLIKNRFYTPDRRNLPDKLFELVRNLSHPLTYEEATEIFAAKQYEDPPMRGRQSLNPLKKMGLVHAEKDAAGLERVKITEFGKMFLSGKIDLGEMVFTSFLKLQFPEPGASDKRDYNIKPFIGVLHLIKCVNEICEQNGEKPKGISREEFGIFALSLKNFRTIPNVTEALLEFRRNKQSLKSHAEREKYVSDFISEYLHDFKNAEGNCSEYADNIVRYLRLTKYIYIRGGGYYIDLEPRRMIEIDALLSADSGEAKNFTANEYKEYIADYHAYVLPFETPEKLQKIAEDVILEIEELRSKTGTSSPDASQPMTTITLPKTISELKAIVEELREHRTSLQNLLLKQEYQDIEKIDNAIAALSSHFKNGAESRPSIEFERWANIALNIMNDAILIKPNSPLGDDNIPTFTAPAKVPDIECFYKNFKAICEVTMLTSRDQWINEGQPVMRHLRDFEDKYKNTEPEGTYCLFIAPRLHRDTINTFWLAVKYEYEGQKQKIVPITITSLVKILQTVKNMKSQRKEFHAAHIKKLYDYCVEISAVKDSTAWIDHIETAIDDWSAELCKCA